MPKSMSLYKKLAPAQDLNEFNKITEDLDSIIFQPKSQDEYKDFISKTPYKISTTALQWWSQEQQQKR
jgi:hypothetical protein